MSLIPTGRLSAIGPSQLHDWSRRAKVQTEKCIVGHFTERTEDVGPRIYYVSLGPKRTFELAKLQLRLAAAENSLAQCHQTIAELLDHQATLLERIQSLEEFSLSRQSISEPADADPCLADVLEITQKMFGRAEVDLEHDPENPECPFVVFTVFPVGAAQELVDKRIEWHARISQVSPRNSGAFRLSIVPKE